MWVIIYDVFILPQSWFLCNANNLQKSISSPPPPPPQNFEFTFQLDGLAEIMFHIGVVYIYH